MACLAEGCADSECGVSGPTRLESFCFGECYACSLMDGVKGVLLGRGAHVVAECQDEIIMIYFPVQYAERNVLVRHNSSLLSVFSQ